MKTVLIFQLGYLHSAPRIYRTYNAIKNDFKVSTAGYNAISAEREKFIDLSRFQNMIEPGITFHLKYPSLLRKFFSFLINVFVLKKYSKIKKFEKLYWTNQRQEIKKHLSAYKFDILIVHGIDALPLAYALCKEWGAKLVFNAHEYYPREFEENQQWLKDTQPLYDYLCKTYLQKADLVFSVTESIRKEYLKNYQKDSVVITNAGEFKNLEVKPCSTPFKIIHHGAAMRGRNIETMIKCAELLDDRFAFDLMLMPADTGYLEEIKSLIGNSEKIKLADPVEFRSIPEFLNQYDIGLYILPLTNFNNEMALPNKFFEFIQGRLMLAISPNPEMAQLAQKYKLGIISSDYTAETMAKELNKLNSESIDQYKKNSSIAAKEMNASVTSQIILNELKKLN